MDKPVSLSVKDWIIRKLAPKMMLSEKTIEAVVNHQFQSANEALYEHKSLEISGFGKLYFNEKKAMREMEKYESQKALFEKMANDESLSESKRRNASLKLQSAIDNIKALKPKLENGSVTDLRGMEEQSSAPREAEEEDRSGEQGEDGDL